MVYNEKLEKVKSGLGLTGTEAHEMVRFLDWMTDENDFLKSIYPAFKRDIDPMATFAKMCLALWNDTSTGIKDLYLSNN